MCEQRRSIEEIEKIEKLVRYIHRPYSPPWWGWRSGTEEPDEKFYDDKVLYYIKLGVTIEELESKARALHEKREKEKEEYERRKGELEKAEAQERQKVADRLQKHASIEMPSEEKDRVVEDSGLWQQLKDSWNRFRNSD